MYKPPSEAMWQDFPFEIEALGIFERAIYDTSSIPRYPFTIFIPIASKSLGAIPDKRIFKLLPV